jgi:PhnB protein
MQTRLNPYISFRDEARAAMTFYQTVFGGELAIDTFGEAHATDDPADQDKVMHSMLSTPGGLLLMAADTPSAMTFTPGDAFSISLSGDDDPELSSFFEQLVPGGTVLEPLATAPWGDRFGMLRDRFGVTWLVNITKPATE